jgi:1-deoxy-D-xylulose-5-phosphate reductoisomerase
MFPAAAACIAAPRVHDRAAMQKRVAILGSTGSVGTQALQIVRAHPDRFAVTGLLARARQQELQRQVAEFRPRAAGLVDADGTPPGWPRDVAFAFGADAAVAVLESSAPDVVLNAITGAAGLSASEWAVRRGKTLALANKESLVMAGGYLMPLARTTGAAILPVDSEHCAIFQCLQGEPDARSSSRAGRSVRKIWLTGSGGPFRTRPLASFASITPAEALRHPTWTMGPRITVGSATMMNKAFEVLEAHWLFDLAPEQIEVVLHPQSIVHSMVEFVDGSMLAQLGLPDMRVPILYCLGYPERLPFPFEPFDLQRWRRLEFEPVDPERYPAVPLAYEVLRRGDDSGAVLNGADEELTRQFLAGSVSFPAIADRARAVVRARAGRPIRSLADVLAADQDGRRLARSLTAATATPTSDPEQP